MKNIYIYSFEVITPFLSEVPFLLGIRQWMKHDLRKKHPKMPLSLIVKHNYDCTLYFHQLLQAVSCILLLYLCQFKIYHYFISLANIFFVKLDKFLALTQLLNISQIWNRLYCKILNLFLCSNLTIYSFFIFVGLRSSLKIDKSQRMHYKIWKGR
jgi:hypothetical protein